MTSKYTIPVKSKSNRNIGKPWHENITFFCDFILLVTAINVSFNYYSFISVYLESNEYLTYI